MITRVRRIFIVSAVSIGIAGLLSAEQFFYLAPPAQNREIEKALLTKRITRVNSNIKLYTYCAEASDGKGVCRVRVILKRNKKYYGEVTVTITPQVLIIEPVRDFKIEIGGYKELILAEGMREAYKEAVKRNFFPPHLVIINAFQKDDRGITSLIKFNNFFRRIEFHSMLISQAGDSAVKNLIPDWYQWEDKVYYCSVDEFKTYHRALISVKKNALLSQFGNEKRNGHLLYAVRHLREACNLFRLYAFDIPEKQQAKNFIITYLSFHKYSRIIYLASLFEQALILFLDYGDAFEQPDEIRESIVRHYYTYIMECEDAVVDDMIQEVKKLKSRGDQDCIVDIILSILFLRKGDIGIVLTITRNLQKQRSMSSRLAGFVNTNILSPAQQKMNSFRAATKQPLSGAKRHQAGKRKNGMAGRNSSEIISGSH